MIYKKLNHPIDRISLALMLLLSLMIGLLVWGGNACGSECIIHTGPRVRDFSWQGKQIGANDTAFIMTFNRPMDHTSVEENLQIEPPLSGKFSWVGRKMAYTLTEPPAYGTTYKVLLNKARERYREDNQPIRTFEAQFITRDRAFAYIGVEGEEQGRLILYNFTKNQKSILTSPDLIVTAFKPYREGNRILFFATERHFWSQGLQEEKLYTVTTGLNRDDSSVGQLELVLDNQDYKNLKFDLSQDGKTIVVQRASRKNPSDFGLWLLKAGEKPQPLNNPPGGDFLIAPDSTTLAMAQGEGIALLPLEEKAKPLDFLPRYGMVLSFSEDGSAAAMVNFNTDNPELRYTRSLYLVTNQNVQKKLLDTNGSILACEFNPKATVLYCLFTQLQGGEEYIELPFLVAINLKTFKVMPVAALPPQLDIHMSMAPDGMGLLFDQIITDPTATTTEELTTNSGEAIATAKLWLLTLPQSELPEPNKTELNELPLPGFRPRWMP